MHCDVYMCVEGVGVCQNDVYHPVSKVRFALSVSVPARRISVLSNSRHWFTSPLPQPLPYDNSSSLIYVKAENPPLLVCTLICRFLLILPALHQECMHYLCL